MRWSRDWMLVLLENYYLYRNFRQYFLALLWPPRPYKKISPFSFLPLFSPLQKKAYKGSGISLNVDLGALKSVLKDSSTIPEPIIYHERNNLNIKESPHYISLAFTSFLLLNWSCYPQSILFEFTKVYQLPI